MDLCCEISFVSGVGLLIREAKTGDVALYADLYGPSSSAGAGGGASAGPSETVELE